MGAWSLGGWTCRLGDARDRDDRRDDRDDRDDGRLSTCSWNFLRCCSMSVSGVPPLAGCALREKGLPPRFPSPPLSELALDAREPRVVSMGLTPRIRCLDDDPAAPPGRLGGARGFSMPSPPTPSSDSRRLNRLRGKALRSPPSVLTGRPPLLPRAWLGGLVGATGFPMLRPLPEAVVSNRPLGGGLVGLVSVPASSVGPATRFPKPTPPTEPGCALGAAVVEPPKPPWLVLVVVTGGVPPPDLGLPPGTSLGSHMSAYRYPRSLLRRSAEAGFAEGPAADVACRLAARELAASPWSPTTGLGDTRGVYVGSVAPSRGDGSFMTTVVSCFPAICRRSPSLVLAYDANRADVPALCSRFPRRRDRRLVRPSVSLPDSEVYEPRLLPRRRRVDACPFTPRPEAVLALPMRGSIVSERHVHNAHPHCPL